MTNHLDQDLANRLGHAMTNADDADNPDTALDMGGLPPTDDDRARDERTHDLMVRLRGVAMEQIERLELEKTTIEKAIAAETLTVDMADAAISRYQQKDQVPVKKGQEDKT
jgi:hypothetical protein